MNELIQNIMDTVNKRGVRSNCKKILKKCSMKSAKDTGFITELAIWLYVYDCVKEAVTVCDLLKNIEFNGNYTLWSNIDHALCLKARIIREEGKTAESNALIDYVNQYRNPELYQNTVDWFLNTLDKNIQTDIEVQFKVGRNKLEIIKIRMCNSL